MPIITKRFAAGVNFYAYCGNNPVNCRDPYGLRDWQNLAFGVGDLALSSTGIVGGFGLMLLADLVPTTAGSMTAFTAGMGLTSVSLLGTTNAVIDIQNAWNETDNPGALETLGNALGGQTGAKFGATADLFTQVLPAFAENRGYGALAK